MHRYVVALLLMVLLLSFGNYQTNAHNQASVDSRSVVSDSVVITTEQDFENGTLENVNSTYHPGDLYLDKEYFTYTVGQLDSPDAGLSGGYTFLPGDSDFIMRSDGVVQKITINVGDYNSMFKAKILRNAGSNNFYAVASSSDLQPYANGQSSFNVNLPVKQGDRLGIYTEGSLSAFSDTGDNGYWWHFGEVQGDDVSMTWDNSQYIPTFQATVRGERYIHYGNWTSNVIELNDIPSRISVSWDSTLFDGTSITMYVRTSSDGIIWNSWQKVDKDGFVEDPQKYVMVWAELQGTDSYSPELHSISLNYDYNINGLVINELSSYGSGNSEWVEIYNSGKDMDITGLEIDDQDGNTYTVPNDIGTMPHDSYLVIYFGSGTDDKDFSDGVAHLYAGFTSDILNDNGDDLVLKIGGNAIDYVAYWSGGFADVDAPPPGLSFNKNGIGYNGYPPSPGSGESLSLVPNGIDNDSASDWHITSGSSMTPGAENANMLIVKSLDIAPSQARQYSEISVIQMDMSAYGKIGEYVTLSNIILLRNGTSKDSDVKSAYIYQDTDKSGNFSSDDSLQAQVNFNNGIANFSMSIGINCGESVTYFIVIQIDENANTSTYANFTLAGMKVNSHNIYEFSGVTTKNVDIIPKDNIPPYVTRVIFMPQSPVSVGTLDISIYFNEAMNTSLALHVSYGPGGYEHTVDGAWSGSTVWKGETHIYSSTENGQLRLIVEDGQDLAGNVMNPNPYQTTFVVDTVAPRVQSIVYSKNQPFGVGSYTITVKFNEDMNTGANPTVKYGILNTTYVTGSWQDSRTWVGTLKVNSYSENGKNTLYIKDAEDRAGNTMVENITYFTIDTTAPHVLSLQFSHSEPLGVGNYRVEVIFSEKMNTSVEPMVSFGVTHVYYVHGAWVNDEEWDGTFSISSDMDNGNNTFIVRDAKDMGGNTMREYITGIRVDTQKPNVVSVEMGNAKAYNAGQHSITIYFDEAMNTSINLNVSYGIKNRTSVTGTWISNTTWQGTVEIRSNAENGNNVLYVSSGKDLAGNEMELYYNFSFIVDTVNPNATIELSPSGPYNNTSTITATIYFSEPVSKVSVLVDSFSFNATPSNGEAYSDTYTLTILGYNFNEGEHHITVSKGFDEAGNPISECSIEFTLDNTPPNLSMDYQQVWVEGDTVEIIAHVSDALTNVSSVKLEYTDSSGHSNVIDMQYVGSGDYVAKLKNVKPGEIVFYVIAEDSAGNTAKKSGDIKVQSYFMSLLWLWILLGIVAGIFIAILIIRARKRRMRGLPALGIKEKFSKPKEEDEEFYEEN